jgi:hypothetical protein
MRQQPPKAPKLHSGPSIPDKPEAAPKLDSGASMPNKPQAAPKPHWVTILVGSFSPLLAMVAAVIAYKGLVTTQNSVKSGQRRSMWCMPHGRDDIL